MRAQYNIIHVWVRVFYSACMRIPRLHRSHHLLLSLLLLLLLLNLSSVPTATAANTPIHRSGPDTRCYYMSYNIQYTYKRSPAAGLHFTRGGGTHKNLSAAAAAAVTY